MTHLNQSSINLEQVSQSNIQNGNTSVNQLLGGTQSFLSTSQILKQEKQEQQKLQDEKQQNENRQIFKKIASVRSLPKSQFLSNFYNGIGVGSPISNITQKPTTAGSYGVFGGSNNNGQANFLKAYSSKVKWQPPQTAGQVNVTQTNLVQGTHQKSQSMLFKNSREIGISDTINKVKQFQLQEHEMKDNFYYMDYINEQIESKLQQSIEKEKIQKLEYDEKQQQILKQQTNQHLLKHLKSNANSITLLSITDTPNESLLPAQRISLLEGFNTTYSQLVNNEKPQNQKQDFNEQKLRESKFRTTSTSKLKTLMKSPNDMKLQVFNNMKRPSNIRDQNKRANLASDLMIEDKILMKYNQIATFYGKDVSFKDDIIQRSLAHNNIQRSQSQDTLINTGLLNQISTQSVNKDKPLHITNISSYPQSFDQLKQMTEILHTNNAQQKPILIEKQNIQKVPDTFYIHTSRISPDQKQKSRVQDPIQNHSQFILQKHNSFQQLQDHLQQQIQQQEVQQEEQVQIYRKREQELLLSLEKLNLSSRVDTIALQEWLGKMLVEIQTKSNDNINELQQFELTQFAYNLTFIELSKQVSLHCSERGTLMQQIWTAFLELMNVQLRHIRAEKNILERETVVSLQRFHDHYENQVQEYQTSTLKMYKESQNYKRSYDRLRKDFESLQLKTSKIGQQLQELTLMYKQKCSRVDFLERTNNNLQSVIQTLQEQSEDEDPNMQDDDYFQKEKKKPKVFIDFTEFANQQASRTRKKSENELGFLQSLQEENQFDFINKVGNDVGDFLYDSEMKREKEDLALEHADQFASAMRGEFFKDFEMQTKTNILQKFEVQQQKPEQSQEQLKYEEYKRRKTLLMQNKEQISVKVEVEQYSDEFYQYQIDQGHLVNMGTEIVNDLIVYADAETLVNEGIFFEDTGINLRADDEQKFVDRISYLEQELSKLQADLLDSNQQLDSQLLFNDLQKDKISLLERQLSEKSQEIEKYQSEIQQLQDELTSTQEERFHLESKLKRLKTKIEDINKVNEDLNTQLEEKQTMIEQQKQNLLDINSPLSQPNGRKNKHLKNRSLGFNEDGSPNYEEYNDDESGSQTKKNARRRTSKSISNGSLFPFGNLRDRGKFRFQEFQLGKRKERIERAHPSQIAFDNFRKKMKIKNIMPKTLLLKTITQTYLDLIELHKTARMPPIIPYIYDQMMHKYGIKKIGYDKFIQLLGTTVKMASTSFRISLFGRLLRIVKPNYDSKDIKIYVEVLSFLQTLNIGVKIDNNEGDDVHFTPLVRAQECLRQHFESKVPIDEWQELKKKLDQIRKADPKGVNKLGIVEVDEFIDMVLTQYQRLETLAAEKVNQLFQATDFNGNAFISCEEFVSSYRNVVQDNWGKEYGVMLFQDYMEEVYDKENHCNLYGISFDSFLKVALEMDILKVKDQNKFLSPMDIDKQFGELLQQLWKKEKQWKQRLTFLQLDEKNSEWLENIEICSKQIKEESLPKRVLLLRTKLIDDETKNMICDSYLEQFFSNDLNAFVKVGIEETYINEYLERDLYSAEQIQEKKKQAGLIQPSVKKDEFGFSILDKDNGEILQIESETVSPSNAVRKKRKASKKGKKGIFPDSLNATIVAAAR